MVIFINAELSRQVLVLLLDHNQHAWERVRKRGRYRGRHEEKGERMRRGGSGAHFLGVSHCELSAVIILLRHLRRGMPHPSAHASVAHGNYRAACVCERACVCVL